LTVQRPVRLLLFSAAALALGGGTLVLGQNLLQARVSVAAKSVDAQAQLQSTTKILVAARTLMPGTLLTMSDLAWRDWPESALDPAYIRAMSAKSEDFIGQIVRTEIVPGEPFTTQRLVAPGSRSALAIVMAPGSRAASISLNPTSGVSGLIIPGDRVDVVLTYVLPRPADASGDGFERRVAETILTNLRVLAVDQRLSGPQGDTKEIRNASLEVTQKQSETLALAADLGKLTLSLRGLERAPGDAVERAGGATVDKEVGRLLPNFPSHAAGRVGPRARRPAAAPPITEFHGSASAAKGTAL